MRNNNIRLTSTEIGGMWTTYMQDSMAVCFFKYFQHHTEDNEILTIVEEALVTSQNHLKQIEKIFNEENLPIPNAFTENDYHLSTPPLFYDLFSLSFVYGLSRLAMPTLDTEGFYAPYGPTTAEQRHSRFMFSYEHECLWNGPSWPFATSQTLTAMANVLNDYEQQVIHKEDYWNILSTYAQCHYRTNADGKSVSWLDENIDPFTGEWLSRRILEEWGWPENKGGRERGKDYNHSTFNDLIITGLIGFRVREDGSFDVNPLVPKEWEYFCLDCLYSHGKEITIIYDKLGLQYNMGIGLAVYIDGIKVACSEELGRLVVLSNVNNI